MLIQALKYLFVNRIAVVIAVLFIFTAEILRVYLVMPYPGSQIIDTVTYAYWLNNHIIWVRLLALAIVFMVFIHIIRKGRLWEKLLFALILIGYTVVFFYFNFRLQADEIFRQPANKSFISGQQSLDKSKLVIGIEINGEAKAYPIQLIGYHHQVMDTIGNTPVMITYCTVCRTGRAFSPIVNGKLSLFRLIGMDHFNAVFEDESTGSWWRQATGVAITGPLKGSKLKEFPSTQLTLYSWLRQYPASLIMLPDSLYNDRYFRLEDYDKGTMQSALVKRDIFSWNPKSWIIGVSHNHTSKAYDWNQLVENRIIQDSLGDLPLLLTIENDSISFHAYDRRVNGAVLQFQHEVKNNQLIDGNTKSVWNMDGICIEGLLKGEKLVRVQAYNEFWHSWQMFQKNAEAHKAN